MTEDLYPALPDLNSAKRKARALTAMIPALPGLIRLAVENTRSYLYRWGTEVMTKEVRAHNEKHSQFRNMVSLFEDYSSCMAIINIIYEWDDREIVPSCRLLSFLKVQKANQTYVFALPHVTQYYDMKLFISGVDKYHSLVISFPVFIKAINREGLVLYSCSTY